MSTETMESLAHRTVASAKQLQSLTHRMRRAKREKVSSSNPPLTESVRGGKKLTPLILLYGRRSFGEAKRLLFCVRSVVETPPVSVWVSFASRTHRNSVAIFAFGKVPTLKTSVNIASKGNIF